MRKNCMGFMEWALSQYDEFMAIWRKATHLGYSYNTHTRKAIIYNLRNGKTASGSIRRGYPIAVAIGLAWAQYKNEEFPE